QRQRKVAVRSFPGPRLIDSDRLGAMVGKGIIKAGEDLCVRNLIVEPERDTHRRIAGVIDQKFQPPWFYGVEPGIGGQREQRGILLSPDGFAVRIDPFVVILREAKGLSVLNDAQAIKAMVVVAKIFRAEKIVRTVGGDK